MTKLDNSDKKIMKENLRRESDKLRDRKRKIGDNKTIQNELSQEELKLIKQSLKANAEQLEQLSNNPDKIIEQLQKNIE